MRLADDARWKAETARRFDAIADRWLERAGQPATDTLDQLRERLASPPGGAILDVGCGTGNLSVPLALAGYRVRGVDLSPRMIANARGAARAAGLDEAAAGFQTGDAEGLPFPDRVFDAILCRNVLDFTPRPGAALVEFRRVLRPGGRLLLSMLGAYSPVKREGWRRFLPGNEELHNGNDILPWEMEALLRGLGWEIVEQFPSFGATFDNAPHHYDREASERLADPILQQTIATMWTFVAVRPGPGPD